MCTFASRTTVEGLLPGREDSFGMAIMSERAERASCALSVSGRPGGGTSVVVQHAGAEGVVARDDSRAAR